MIRFALRDLSRDFRVSLVVPVIALAVSIASITGVKIFTSKIQLALKVEGRSSAGSDVEMSSSQPIPSNAVKGALALLPQGTRSTEVLEFVSMAVRAGTGASRLVEVRVIGEGYPFYGEFKSERGVFDFSTLKSGSIAIHRDLLPLLDLSGSDQIRLGEKQFKIHAVIQDEPGINTSAFNLGPKVWIRSQDLKATGLAVRGSRIRHRVLFAIPGVTGLDFPESLRSALEGTVKSVPEASSVRIRSFSESNRQLNTFQTRLGNFMTALGMVILLLAGVAVSVSTRSWIQARLGTIAILRCLGADGGQLYGIFLVQILTLGVLGSGFGVMLGLGVGEWIPSLMRGILDVPPSVGPPFAAVFQSLAIGVSFCVLFAWLGLAEVPRVQALDLLRSDPKPKKLSLMQWGATALLIAYFFLVVWLETRSIPIAAYLTLGITTLTTVLLGGFLALVKAGEVALSNPAVRIPLPERYGLRNSVRWKFSTAITLCVLTLGSVLLVSVELLRSGIQAEFSEAKTGDRPSLFLIDIAPDQRDSLMRKLTELGFKNLTLSPLVQGRWTSPRADDSSREFRLSQRKELYPTESIVQGRWWTPTAANSTTLEASIEKEWAERSGVKLGDTLSFEIQGVPLQAQVTSLRAVKWTSFQPNFFVLLSPGALDGAPATWIASAGGAASPTVKIDALKWLSVNAPTATAIDVEDAVSKFTRIVEKVESVVRFLAFFALVAGMTILGFSVLESIERRRGEIKLVRTLGASKRFLSRALVAEFAMISGIACIVSASLSGIVTRWVIAPEFNLQAPWITPSALAWLGLQMAIAVGLAWSAIRRPSGL